MFPVLADDVLGVIFIDQAVAFQDRQWGYAFFDEPYDSHLVFQWDLGIRHKDIRKEGVCSSAFLAENPLDAQVNAV